MWRSDYVTAPVVHSANRLESNWNSFEHTLTHSLTHTHTHAIPSSTSIRGVNVEDSSGCYHKLLVRRFTQNDPAESKRDAVTSREEKLTRETSTLEMEMYLQSFQTGGSKEVDINEKEGRKETRRQTDRKRKGNKGFVEKREGKKQINKDGRKKGKETRSVGGNETSKQRQGRKERKKE